MPFVTIDPLTIEVGDPLKAELFDKIKDNEDDLDSRVNTIETNATKIDVFKFLLLNGSVFSTATGLSYFRAESTFTITKGAIQIFEKGSLAGFLEIDVKKSTTDLDTLSFSSIFSVKPKITYSTASDYDESSNQVLNGATTTISPGDYLRLDITIAPTGGVVPKFFITVYGE